MCVQADPYFKKKKTKKKTTQARIISSKILKILSPNPRMRSKATTTNQREMLVWLTSSPLSRLNQVEKFKGNLFCIYQPHFFFKGKIHRYHNNNRARTNALITSIQNEEIQLITPPPKKQQQQQQNLYRDNNQRQQKQLKLSLGFELITSGCPVQCWHHPAKSPHPR